MIMYKKAAQQKLRFETTRGTLSVEQLFDLPLSVLEKAIRKVREEIKKETQVEDDLSFLNNTTPVDDTNQLRFDILKDIYVDKSTEIQKAKTAKEDKEHNQRILELIKEKQDKALADKSIEELQAMLKK